MDEGGKLNLVNVCQVQKCLAHTETSLTSADDAVRMVRHGNVSRLVKMQFETNYCFMSQFQWLLLVLIRVLCLTDSTTNAYLKMFLYHQN